jgi:cysteine desulfurase / selenocysteine lyase
MQEALPCQWSEVRRSYPALQRFLYADNAAVGAVPATAVTAANQVINDIAAEGMLAYVRYKSGLGEVRATVADYLGAAPADIGFTDSTSTSMNLLALMARQEWAEGRARRDQVVLPRDEFPSSTLGWLRQGFEPVWVEPEPDMTYPAEKILAAVGPRARAVITSQVQYKTGARCNVEVIAKELAGGDIWHVMNATQSAGVIPQTMRSSAYAAATISSVKWLCGGVGTGVLYLSDRLRQSCRIPVAGWMSQADPFAMANDTVMTVADASGVETGAVELSRLYALQACIRIAAEMGTQRVHRRVLELNGRLAAGLQAFGACVLTPLADERRAGILSVRKENASAWRDWARERGVLVSVRGATALRFSLHFFNDQGDVEGLLEAWREGPR